MLNPLTRPPLAATSASSAAAPARPGAAKPADSEAEIDRAASQFEALLIGQLLAGLKTGQGLSGGEDQSGGTMLEFAQEHLASAIANGGGLGLSALLRSGLRPKPSGPSVNLPLSRP